MVDTSNPGIDALHAQLHGGVEQRLRLALSAGNFGIWDWDIASGVVTWSEEIYRFYKLNPESFNPRLESFVERIHHEDRAQVQEAIENSIENGKPYHVQFRGLRSDDEIVWLEGWGQVVRDVNDQPVGMIGLVQDATERLKSEDERAQLLRRERDARTEAEAGRQRMSFLTQAFRVLGSSLDLTTTINRLLTLMVPHMGDWATVYLVRDGRIEPMGGRHRDPDKQAVLESLLASVEVDFDSPGGIAEVLNNGATVLENDFDDQILEEAGLDAEQRSQVEEIGIQSYMIVPLRVSDRIIGTLSVGGAVGARPYGQDDLDLAERIADRAGVAIHNAIQFTQRTKIAKVLQRSLLPAGFPNIPGCQMAGTYRSAGEGLDVGGDFYDVFQIDATRFGIAIGDVSGKGHEAAAITALTRHTIRAAAVTIANPHEVLLAANEVLLGQAADSRFCTAAFGIATVGESGHLSIRFANAGHLPPLVARLDGRIEPIESAGVLLGMFPDASFEDVTIDLKPGEVFLLYTDGLTDVMIKGNVLGDDWLRAELAAVREKSVGEIVRTIEERVTGSGSVLVDDVAVLAVKTVGGSP